MPLAMLGITVLLATVAVLSFLSGGYILHRVAPVVFVLAGVATAAIWWGRGFVRPSRPYVVALVAFTALVAWTGLSILWSLGPDLSWIAFDVAALYLLVMAGAGLLPGGPAQLRLAGYGFGLVVVVVAAYAFLGKIAPDVVASPDLFPRLRAPIGYWNVLAALIVMATPVFLVVASRRESRPWVRGLSASALVLLDFTFFFTFSRGGYVALAATLLVFFLLTTRRLAAFASLVIPVTLTALVLASVRHLDSLFEVTADERLRAAQGHELAVWFAAALAVAFVAQTAVAMAERRWTLSARRVRVVGAVLVAVVVLVPPAFASVYVVQHGGASWLSAKYHAALSPGGPTNDVERLTSAGTSERVPRYRAALRGFTHHVVEGTGAGTFRFTNDRYRQSDLVVKHSHSEWLNRLSELGIVGFALFAVTIGGLMVAAFSRLLRDRRDPDRALLAACQAALVAFVVHISIDWGWDMPVITVAFLLLAGVCSAYVNQQEEAARARLERDHVGQSAVRSRPLPAAATPSLGVRVLATGVIAFGVVCWVLPYAAERATATARDRLSRGDVAAAQSSARRASALDRLSVEPLFALAAAQEQAGDLEGAKATLERAVRLQPDNFKTYSQMGDLQLEGFRDKVAARLWYQKALELSPRDAGTRRKLAEL